MHISRATLMVCQFLLPLINAQRRRGHYVCVCGSDDEHATTLKSMGIEVLGHQLQRTFNPLKIVKAILQIKRHIKNQNIDTVICHTPLGAGVGRIAAKMAGVPHIIYFAHGLPCAPGQNKAKWLIWFIIEKILAMNTTGLLVMNRYDQELGENRLMRSAQQVVRIPGMGVDLDRFYPTVFQQDRGQIQQELGIPLDSKMVLSIAYMLLEKGIFVYFQSALQVCRRHPDLHFLIAGDGPQQSALENAVHVAGLSSQFHVLGWRRDIDRLMRAADIFVLPSFYFEGLPVAILEAMACAKPVIATRHRGCEDAVINNQTGFLIPRRDPAALAEKIELLYDKPELRSNLGKAGRRRVEKNFELRYCTQLASDGIETLCGVYA